MWSNCTLEYTWTAPYYNATYRLNGSGDCIVYANQTFLNQTNGTSTFYACPFDENLTYALNVNDSYNIGIGSQLINTTHPPSCFTQALYNVNTTLNATLFTSPGMGIENIPYEIIILLGIGTLWGGYSYYKYKRRS
jgi:hypothetical protein